MKTPSGSRPALADYQSAVARLAQCSKDPRLKRCRPTTDSSDGQPAPDGGSFGVVFRLTDPEDERAWALKCFLRDEPHRGKRYREIANCLGGARGSWRTEVHYVHEGLWVHGRWWPVVLMEWVPGKRLTDWIDHLLDHRRQDAARELRRLAHRFASAVYQMHRSGISHGDLQGGNVLVADDSAVRFVDYDAMTVPGWSRPPRREDGHPDFRLPREGERGADGATHRHTEATDGTVFTTSTSAGIPIQEPDALVATHRDRFPSHVIHTSLVMLSHDLSLWAALHQPGSDGLLLSRKDFRDPMQSLAWPSLLNHAKDEVRVRARKLRALLDCPVGLQPDLEPEPEVAPRTDVLGAMAFRPATGPRSSARPFLDVGIFPAHEEPQVPGSVPAAEPPVVPAAEPAPARAVKPEPAPARAVDPEPAPAPFWAADPRPAPAPAQAADAEPGRPTGQPEAPLPAWFATPVYIPAPPPPPPVPEPDPSPAQRHAAAVSKPGPYSADVFADYPPLSTKALSPRGTTGAKFMLVLLSVLLVLLVVLIGFFVVW